MTNPSQPGDVAAAMRRAAVEHHHRSLVADLEADPGRAAILARLAETEHPTSLVVVRASAVDPDVAPAPALWDQVTARLRSIVREPDDVHRFGTRFLVVVPGTRYAADAVARRVAAAVREPFSVGGDDLRLRTATGIAEVDPADPVVALQRADLAAHRHG